ncbi:triacylglycerol lipase OBL1-like [Telopea speciosissima]|uniref:triacylglycerol lipase OBL1-like n=1 Tax=Telopea speciosissima TaxID=54955 RepID=UPI001CC3F8BB|nr:triacylglycerol lipase OBL1-like [Telopea speciosissima]
MESTCCGSSSSYIIYRPEKLKRSHILDFLLPWRSLKGSGHVEISSSSSHHDDSQGSIEAHWITFFSCVLQKIMLRIRRPLSLLGFALEFTLNLFSVNGGILKLIATILRGSVVIPNSESKEWRSFLGHIDGRIDLHRSSSVPSCISKTAPTRRIERIINPLELCMMASKVAYENPAYVNNAVTNHWKMHFEGFFNCWNVFLKEKTTHAFIFCDRPKNARLIVVAFRGTEPFNAKNWCTDLDLSWLSMGKMGRVHLGFMKALGLQDEKDVGKGWPKEYRGDKELAYYLIGDKLRALVEKNKGAKILITGHSLGAALATLFPAILIHHQQTSILSRLFGVYTFGQPRVGDKQFGSFMETHLNSKFKRYVRVVYRYDIVPRIPFDDPYSQFVHFGGCLYYHGWYRAQVLNEEPDENYFSPFYLLSKHFHALLDLSRALYIGIQHGKDYTESSTSILFRVFGLLVPGVASHSPRDCVNAARLGR